MMSITEHSTDVSKGLCLKQILFFGDSHVSAVDLDPASPFQLLSYRIDL